MSNHTPKPKREVSTWYVLRFARPYTRLISVSLIFLIAGTIAASLQPLWLKKIIDQISHGTTLHSLASLLIIYFGLKLFEAIFETLRDVVFAPAEMGIARAVSKQLFIHLLTLPVCYHHEQRLGGISRKITRGGRAIQFILDFMVSNIIPTVFQLIFVTILLFRLYAPVYAIVTFCTVVSYTFFTIWSTEKRQKYRLAANVADDEVASLEVDALGNIDTIKYFNNESEQVRHYQPAIDHRYRMAVGSNTLFGVISGVQGLILTIGLGIILYLGILQNLRGQLTIGDLVLLTTYVVQLSAPIATLGFVYRQIKDGLADLDGMATLLQEKITLVEPEHPKHITKPEGAVEFRNVSFTYANGREVLKAISLTIKPGQKVAFVGPSGVGKSTIVKLLFRLYEPSDGDILIDHVSLRDVGKEDRHDIFAIVPQEPALFNATIAENIRFGKPDATDAEVEAAALLANAHIFIKNLNHGYATLVGERGVKLSGGEKQRVAIARAIIRNPRILVFDEATSALDSHSEGIILESLERAAKGRTTIAIAHRLSTIAGSDTIYVLKDGLIAEHGTHAELLAAQGTYATMWRKQAEQKEIITSSS